MWRNKSTGANIFPDACPDTVELPETDTSPVTMTVFQRVPSSIQFDRPDVVASGDVDVEERSSESDDGVSEGEYCDEK